MNKKSTYFIIVYCSLLVFGSLPTYAINEFLVNLKQVSTNALEVFTILPGLELFHRAYNETHKVRGQCIQVKAVTTEQQIVDVYKTPIACQVDQLKYVPSDTFEIIFHRMIEDAAVERMHLVDRFGEEALKGHIPLYDREVAVYQKLGSYFCFSSLVDRQNKQFAKIALTWRQDKIEYTTGKIYHPYMLFMQWNCETKKFDFIDWSPYLNEEMLNAFQNNKNW